MVCKHEWRVDQRIYVDDSCIGARCIKCGKASCGCEVLDDNNGKLPKNFFNNKEEQ